MQSQHEFFDTAKGWQQQNDKPRPPTVEIKGKPPTVEIKGKPPTVEIKIDNHKRIG